MELFWAVFVFLVGLCIGSFLNVCIYRIPRGQSIVFPGSYCPKCGKAVAWHDNIPVLGFLLIAGKCRACKTRISWRYPVIEIINAVVWVLLWQTYGSSVLFYAGCFLFSALLTVSITDLETGFINDRVTYPGMAAGFVLSGFFPELQGETVWQNGLAASALGIVAGGGLLLCTGWLGELLFKKEAMGGGDIKLLAMIGAFIGMKDAGMVFFLSPILALPVALVMKYVRKEETIPYGPYLAVMGMLYFVIGNKITEFFF